MRVHVTIAYHENTRETLTRFGEWNQRFEAYPDLIRPVYQPADIDLAQSRRPHRHYLRSAKLLTHRRRDSLVEVMRRLGSDDHAVDL